MNNNLYRLLLIPQFVLMILNILFILMLSVPFIGHSLHNILGGHLYYDIDYLILGVSVLLGSILSILVFKKRYLMKQMIIILSIQFLVLICFFTIYYLNMHELSELMNSPSYE